MAYASIVIAAAGSPDDRSAVGAAFELAKRHRATATVVVALPELGQAVGLAAVVGSRGSPAIWQALDDSRTHALEETMAVVADEAARLGMPIGMASGPPCVVTAPTSDEPWSGLQRELPLADFVVVAPSAARGEGPWTGLLAEALMSRRAPVLIAGGRSQVAGAPAAVAWDGSPEAGRAARAATPMLRDASSVTILQDTRALDTSPGSAADPDRLFRYLEGRGVREVSLERLTGPRPGSAILAAAKSLNAALLVAGAFGHARLSETLFGGATKTFLHADGGLHLFLSH